MLAWFGAAPPAPRLAAARQPPPPPGPPPPPRRSARLVLLRAAPLEEASGAPVPFVRVNKCFRGFASRREADRFVEEGRVTVNGARAAPGQRVAPGDAVALDGRPVRWEALQAELAGGAVGGGAVGGGASAGRGDDSRADGASGADPGAAPLPLEERFVYIKYWKPRGVVCTCDPGTRGNIVDTLRDPPDARLFPVGRLDKETTGAILLTSDGRVVRRCSRARSLFSSAVVVYFVNCIYSSTSTFTRPLTAPAPPRPPKTAAKRGAARA
jgi:hypothetical protein